MRVSPLDIQQHQFKVRLRGFDKKEVMSFLEIISNEMEELIVENKALKEDVGKKEDTIIACKEREKNINEAIIATQRIIEDMKSNARKEAELIISEAEIRAGKIVEVGNQELIDIQNKILDLKKQKLQYDSALRSLIETHLQMLDIEKD